MGYKSEFKREFTNLGTISFAFSIMCVLLLCARHAPSSRLISLLPTRSHTCGRALDTVSQGSMLVCHIYLRHAHASRWPCFGRLVLDVSSASRIMRSLEEQVLTPPNFPSTVWEQRDASSSELVLQSSSPHTLQTAVSTRLLATWSPGGIADLSDTLVRRLFSVAYGGHI